MELEKLTETKLNLTINPSVEAAANNVGADASGGGGGLLSQVVKDKKKKKKKLSAKEKAKEKLESSSDKLLSNAETLNNMIVTVAYWLDKYRQKTLYKLFNQQYLTTLDHEAFLKSVEKEKNEADKDQNDDENEAPIEINTLSTIDFKISYEDFKLVTRDMRIPCTKIQLHALCKLLDPESNGRIDYRRFTPEYLESHIKRHFIDGLRFIKKSELTRHGYTFDKQLATNFASQYPMYIKIDLRLITFANDKEYKGHIKNEIVYTHLKVYSLVEMIKERLDVASYKISIYRDSSMTKAAYLNEKWTLEECGFNGSSNYNEVLKSTEKTMLYFDYVIVNSEDPILRSDFYYHEYKKD